MCGLYNVGVSQQRGVRVGLYDEARTNGKRRGEKEEVCSVMIVWCVRYAHTLETRCDTPHPAHSFAPICATTIQKSTQRLKQLPRHPVPFHISDLRFAF